jgi:hypothetical protein
VLYRDTARDGGAGRWESTTCGGKDLTTASPSSSLVGGVASYAVLADRDPSVGHCVVVDDVFQGCARCNRGRGAGLYEREGETCF